MCDQNTLIIKCDQTLYNDIYNQLNTIKKRWKRFHFHLYQWYVGFVCIDCLRL